MAVIPPRDQSIRDAGTGDHTGARSLAPALGNASAPSRNGGVGVPGEPARHRRVRRKHWPMWAAGGLVLVAAAALSLWILARPHLQLVAERGALARVELEGVGGRLSHVGVSADGRQLPVAVIGDRILPKVKVAPGTTLTVEATLREPGWISWITGPRARVTERTVAPSASLAAAVVNVAPGTPVTAHFDTAVDRVSITGPKGRKVLSVDPPSTTVAIATPLPATSAGVATVAGTVSAWESFPKASVLTYFAPSPETSMALIPDGAGAPTLTAGGTIELDLSRPVSTVFGGKLPTLTPTTAGAPTPDGTWTQSGPDDLVFTPAGPAFWPGEQLTMTLPARLAVVEGGGRAVDPSTTVTLNGPPSSVLRLQQLLASLDYLPVAWTPSAGAADPTTVAGQAALMDVPQPGSFSWRWPMPSALTSQWAAGTDTVMTTGAVMSFEDVEGLNYSGNPLGNPLLWPTLLKAYVAKQLDPRPYVWVEVSKTLPERLWLWSNGSVVLTSLANTGIPSTTTQDGTFTVYLRYQENYMSGFNPTGSYYHDLVHWISYFNGGDAVHGFPRASYGFPQSLGCVELPVGGGSSVSHRVWPYDRIGTLVTVLPQGAPTTA